MKEFERKTLLEKLEREGGTIGATIPEEVEVEGREVPLRRYVVGGSRPEVPFSEKEMKKHLRRLRLDLVEELEQGDLGYDEGERLVERVRGIGRALETLEGSGGSVEREAQAAEVADEKRWRSFLEEVSGEDEDGRRSR